MRSLKEVTGKSALWISGQLDVENYYAACTNNVNNGVTAMNVYGRFTPATDYFYGCTLQGGATNYWGLVKGGDGAGVWRRIPGLRAKVDVPVEVEIEFAYGRPVVGPYRR